MLTDRAPASGQASWIFDSTTSDLFVQSFHRYIVKRDLSADHSKQNNSQRPRIDFRSDIWSLSQHFWSGKVGGSAENVKPAEGAICGGKSVVCENDEGA
jgi:hypothetical protein